VRDSSFTKTGREFLDQECMNNVGRGEISVFDEKGL
jgi:hypothetical protein